MASLLEIEPRELKKLLDSGLAIVIDVREPDEHAREHIPGSRLEPLSRLDAARVPADNGQTVVLHCERGRRSAEAGAKLLAAGRPGATHLKGGLAAWKAAGLPLERKLKAPMPIMRQVQLTVGLVVVAGSVLSWLVSPLFLGLVAFMGAGLVFSGATGTCGLAAVLGMMPWNRTSDNC